MGSYTIGELAKLAGVTTRTVRYYISEGLLPPPQSGGQADRYDDDHLRRLELIRGLKAEYLPLAEIRARLETLDREAVQELVEQTTSGAAGQLRLAEKGSAQEYLRALLHPGREGALREAVDRRAQAAPVVFHERAPASPPQVLRSAASAAAPAPAPGQGRPRTEASAARPQALRSPTLAPAPDHATAWIRYAVHPDIELHMRQPARDGRLQAHLAEILHTLEETVAACLIQDQEEPHE